MNGSSVIFSLARRCRWRQSDLGPVFSFVSRAVPEFFPVPSVCVGGETNAINCEMQLSPGNQFDETNSCIDPCFNLRQKGYMEVLLKKGLEAGCKKTMPNTSYP